MYYRNIFVLDMHNDSDFCVLYEVEDKADIEICFTIIIIEFVLKYSNLSEFKR